MKGRKRDTHQGGVGRGYREGTIRGGEREEGKGGGKVRVGRVNHEQRLWNFAQKGVEYMTNDDLLAELSVMWRRSGRLGEKVELVNVLDDLALLRVEGASDLFLQEVKKEMKGEVAA